MKFKLIDTALRETSKYPALVKISPDGNLAYVVYEIEATDKSDLVAELFDISNNKLDTLAVYVPENMKYPSICSGFPNQDFTLFSIIESNGSSIRVRLLERGVGDYSPMLVVKSEIILDDKNYESSLGGNFLPDGTLMVCSNIKSSSSSQNSRIWILNPKANLRIIDYKDVKGIITTNPISIDGEWPGFALCKSKGVLNFKNLTNNWRPKHKLVLYICWDGIVKADEVELPQGALSLEVHNSNQLIVGTALAILPNERNIKIKSDEHMASDGSDGNELRVYDITNWNLKLKYSKDTNSHVESAYITPNGEHLIISQKIGNYSDFGPSVLQITDANKCNLKSLSIGVPLNGFVKTSVDDNCTKLLIGTANDDKYRSNNLLLYIIE